MAKKRRKQRPRRQAAERAPAAGAASKTAPKPVRKPIEEERPEAPWAPFPLVELLVLAGLAMIVVAFFTDGRTSTALLVVGLSLGSLAGLELSIREHFGGYRSHTSLLAGAAGVAVIGFLFYARPGRAAAGRSRDCGDRGRADRRRAARARLPGALRAPRQAALAAG